ncbi:hypothetical protein FOZ76_07640 [Verticiella sediminum]|uniref:Arylmalonate decarboxylase n=1 Tax=Verticiella sediminum TaxID=1247510 RepID=A0A556AWY2_9BURK|nr:hypothetical protein [Verticiella sediminum]TSH96895.1 hypothetical protein FOZ76_07640 [Verticiella sediminum]
MTHLPSLGQPRHRIGALVPPANPTVEFEYPALLPAEAALHCMRLPVIAGDLEARNRAYLESYAPSLSGFGSLKLDGVAIALTGSQYRIGHDADRRLCDSLSEAFGAPVETASVALANALRHLGIRRISMVSPYPDWLTQLAVGYWKSAGVQVDHIEKFADELVAYQLTPEQVAERLVAVHAHPDGAVLLSGTGMPTLQAIVAAGPRKSVPILSSNLCSLWSLAHAIGVAPPAWLGEAFPWFANPPQV